jgi:surfeit locus 1 family protein
LLLAVAATVGFAALGLWQLERRAWKIELIERVTTRIHANPVAAPARDIWPSINPSDDAYRRVYAEGHFLHERETLVQAVTEAGAGYWVLTPLQTQDGSTILVNRGFVPPERREPNNRPEGLPDSSVRVTGLLRITEPAGAFLRRNDPAADRWYSRDVAAIASARRLWDAAPFFIDADAAPNPGGWPLGGLTVVAFSNHHFIYALTWFALALMSAGAALRISLRTWRLGIAGVSSRSSRPMGAVFGERRSAAPFR